MSKIRLVGCGYVIMWQIQMRTLEKFRRQVSAFALKPILGEAAFGMQRASIKKLGLILEVKKKNIFKMN